MTTRGPRAREFVDDQGILRQKTAEQRRLVEREHNELGKRLERWYEGIKTESDLGDVGAERLREAKRDLRSSGVRVRTQYQRHGDHHLPRQRWSALHRQYRWRPASLTHALFARSGFQRSVDTPSIVSLVVSSALILIFGVRFRKQPPTAKLRRAQPEPISGGGVLPSHRWACWGQPMLGGHGRERLRGVA
jgi:hypothetical protein